MPGKRTWIAAVLAGLLASTGCCGWCHKHCGCSAPAPVAPVAYAPAAAPACCVPCCPASTAPIQAVPAPPTPAYSSPNGCCTPR